MNYIYGINAVAEALKARGRSFEWVGVLKERHDLRLQRVVEECRRNGVAVRFLGGRSLIAWLATMLTRVLWPSRPPGSTTTWMTWLLPSGDGIRWLSCWTELRTRTIWVQFSAL